MIRVWLTLLDIRTIKPKAEEILCGLPEELRKKALRYRKEDDQLRSIGSSFLLLKAAKGHEIHYTSEGKPFTDSANNFNISHSGDYVVLAESDAPVGVDVERVSDFGIDDDLRNIALTEREKLWVKDSTLRFFVVWTRKESLIKCEGSGFISEPYQIETLSDENFDEPVNYRGKIYRIESFMLDCYVISVCTVHESLSYCLSRIP
ncbi:MAG: 4'-phosphopantetheinyl transferase superfamily protein [Synergistaceae bacterium]|nr:4'-phosphopantetheinyl transferase superfamily protein [Synergistaceae bacterium]